MAESFEKLRFLDENINFEPTINRKMEKTLVEQANKFCLRFYEDKNDKTQQSYNNDTKIIQPLRFEGGYKKELDQIRKEIKASMKLKPIDLEAIQNNTDRYNKVYKEAVKDGIFVEYNDNLLNKVYKLGIQQK